MTTPQLIEILDKQYGIEVSRNTLANDFKMLEQVGVKFEVVHSQQNQYYYDGRVFDLAELKIMIDAISSSKFITEKKSRDLIEKVLSLTTEHNATSLRRHVHAEGRVKSENERGYYIVDTINDAIDGGYKIKFQYADYNTKKRKVVRHDGEYYVVSPYALVWDGDYYYMIGYCNNREHMRHFRLDRIYRIPTVLVDEEAVPAPKNFQLAKYLQRVFRMYGGEETVEVELLCADFIMNAIIDHFGTSVRSREIDDNHFVATVEVSPSPNFYRWVFGWNGAMKIISPK